MGTDDPTWLQRALGAVDQVQRDPRAALHQADCLVREAPRDDADARATAERAAGLALRQLDEVPVALRRLRRAVRVADAGASPSVRAWTRLSYAFVLASAGRNAEALTHIDAALPYVHGGDAGRARMQRGVVHHYLGRYAEASRDYAAALAVARRHDDVLGQARALNNLGVVEAHLGATGRARAALDEASELFQALGLEAAAADALWNVAYVMGASGDLPTALATFARAQDEHRRLGLPRPGLALDRLEVLLSVPLVDEALALAADLVAEMHARHLRSELAEAYLGQARAALAAGDLELAATAARTARDHTRRQGRTSLELVAEHVLLRVRYLSGRRTHRLAEASHAIAETLDATGWRTLAAHARLDGAQVLADLGETAAAVDELAAVSRLRRGGTATTRVLGWYAEGWRRRLTGDVSGAERALRRGLDELDRHRGVMSATDMRVGAGAHGVSLARQGLDLALRQGRPARVLAWSERCRAGALRLTPARPPDDPVLAGSLSALRLTRADQARARLAGEPTHALSRRQVELERAVVERARQASSTPITTVGGTSVSAVCEVLGPDVLVEFVEHEEQLHAIVLRRGRASLHALGDVADVARRLERLRFVLRQLGASTPSPIARAAVRHAVARLGTEVDDALIGPIRTLLGHAGVVMVPSASLHPVPWALLPSCRGRAVTVAPSAGLFVRAAARTVRAPGSRQVLVSGPGLPGGSDEIAALARQMPTAEMIVGRDATSAGVLAAMNGARLVHVAAHGHLRSDNPLFSSLQLADGPMTVYDLERLTAPPSTVVLSACYSGDTAVRPGDELIGLSACLLGMGTRALVAPFSAVDDATTRDLMLAVHGGLARGLGVAAALAYAQALFTGAADRVGDAGEHVGGDADVALASAAAFTCFGAGLTAL